MDHPDSFAWTGYRAPSAHSRSSSSPFSSLAYRCSLPESNVRAAVGDDDAYEEPPTWPRRVAPRSPSSPSLDAEVDLPPPSGPSSPHSQLSVLQLQLARYDLHPAYNSSNNNNNNSNAYASHYSSPYSNRQSITAQSFSSPVLPAPDSLVSNSPEPPVLYLTDEYKALAEPMSAWLALYFVNALSCPEYSRFLPSLTAFIRSVLWSTMLQPSAVFLALYYLNRLGDDLVPHRPSSDPMVLRFRDALYGDDGTPDEGSCRKLFVCVAMLADRELHDNCFSSATWGDITHIPMVHLSALDFCSLQMLDHSLWVPPQTYCEWVYALREFHASVPADALSADQGALFHQMVHLQMNHVLTTLFSADANPKKEPVFLVPGERLVELQAASPEQDDESEWDIDLDEDGPLREEYIPRRVSSFSSRHSSESRTSVSPPVTPCSGPCVACEQEDYFKPQGQRQWLSSSDAAYAQDSHHVPQSDGYLSRNQSWKSFDSIPAVQYSTSAALMAAGPSARPCPVSRNDMTSYSSRHNWLLA